VTVVAPVLFGEEVGDARCQDDAEAQDQPVSAHGKVADEEEIWMHDGLSFRDAAL